jgi:hypothetical protein
VLAHLPACQSLNLAGGVDFFTFFISFFQKYMVRFFFSKLYIRGTVALAIVVGHDGRGPVCDEGKLYMKIITFNEIYNFLVQSFSI